MNWEKVAQYLADEAERLRRDAPAAFPNDFETQKGMLNRASILLAISRAISAGLPS